MPDFKDILGMIYNSLHILQEREAKHSGNAPPELINQINDHQEAIALTEQTLRGELSETEWKQTLQSLLLGSELQNSLAKFIPDLPLHEQRYRQRLKEHYAETASYFVELISETQVVLPGKALPPDEFDTAGLARFLRANDPAGYHEWIPTGQEIKRIKLNSLREGVDKYPCIILLGDPGSGKTTALENLAYQLADESDRLPLPLRLSEFEPGMTLQDFIVQVWSGSLEANHWNAPELAANLEDYLEAGQLFCLFDALNEMPRKGYKDRAQALRRFIDRWSQKGNRFVVTCRILEYGEELSGLQRVEVQPFNDERIKALLQKVLPKQWQTLWQVLTDSQDDSHRLLEMARNPYVLNMMIYVFTVKGQLSQRRAELMTTFTQILWHWAEKKCPPDEWLDADVQHEALSVLAFEMQDRAGSGTVVETRHVKKLIPTQVQTNPNYPPDDTPPDQVLKLAASANIIEMPVDHSTVRFYHQLLQEYFTARELIKRDPASLTERWRWPWLEEEMPLWERPEGSWDPLPPPPPTGWEETTILAAGLAAENDDQLVQALIEVNPVLAGRCLHEGRAKVTLATRQAVVEALLATIARPEVALRVRIATGEILGHLGDPRLGELVTVPVGEFLMGSSKTDRLAYRDDEKPQHPLFLPDYQVGKYPVTNAEYARFVEAGGYADKRWWTEAGWRKKEEDNWTEPKYWQVPRFNKPNYPVVGVSWYESVAYCRWLRAETGSRYRLPTEAEWEKTARGTDGWIYPWGNEFETSRFNSREGEQSVFNTTPVGIYPTEISPFGASDCAGNVAEWCATRSGKDYPYKQTDDEWTADYLGGTNVRMLRGGSWLDLLNGPRCAFRYSVQPDGRDLNWGFRLWCSPI